ncbi:hypothetical protein [Kitasatospora sp. McL0602]|uniref:hypothetical protein n=1 Tax=Kitasatospora sp. McL0602 TaxID=3439530 RepID=UPI003F88ADE8
MNPTPPGALRRGLSGVAVAAAVPYLTLKLLWLCGSTVGFVDPADAQARTLWALNLASFGMDAVAVVLALALVRPWGRRLPAALPAFPMWVATGLLGTLLAALPVDLLANLLLGPEQVPPTQQADGLRPWVYVLVYGGFSVQGLALLAAFALYARERWPGLLRSTVSDLPRTDTLTLQRVLTCAAVLLAAPATFAHLYWAFGGQSGLPRDQAGQAQRSFEVMHGVWAALTVVACTAMLALVFRWSAQRRLLLPLVAAWYASGSVFAWGAWTWVANSLSVHAPDPDRGLPPASLLSMAAQTGAGLLMLVVGSIMLIERACRADVESGR